MDLSDILFYIVIGAIGIFSFASQRKAQKQAEEIKRRKQQQSAQHEEPNVLIYDTQEYNTTHEKDYEKHQSPAETQQELSLEEIFKALRERRTIPVPQEKPTSQVSSTTEKPVAKTQPTPVVKTKPIISTPQEEGQRAISDELAQHAITDENIYNNELHDNEGTTCIDWRQAIIFSEILNRKY